MQLPPGFVLEGAQQPQAQPQQMPALPAGFELEQQPEPRAALAGKQSAQFGRIQQHANDGSQNAVLSALKGNPLTAALSAIMPAESVVQGMSAGFGDEAMALIKSALGQGAYDEVLAGYNQRLNKTRAENPISSVAGEVSGALLTAPVTPAVRIAQGLGLGGRALNAAATGAAYGGVYGAGSAEPGLENRTQGALSGAVTGFLTGGIAAPLVEGVVAGARTLAQPFRGLRNPDVEAQRRVATAIQRDNPGDQTVLPRAADALETANASNIPLVVADMGGETTRALARSSANSSPPARAALNNAVNDRFETQNDRISNTVRAVIGGDPNAPAIRQAVQQEARNINRPAYQRAYTEGQNVWDEALADLVQAPDMQTAIRTATIRGNNQAAVNGFEQVRNPFTTGQDGRLTLREGVTPNLQFWDSVRQNLDKINTRESQFLARSLRDHLDTVVPSYRTARAGAAAAFGAQDALEAGQRFASSSMPIKEASQAFQNLNNAERQLFAQGFASDLLDKIAKTGDRRNVINSLFGSQDARQRLHLALGPQGARRLEAAARVENVMDLLRSATQGNSTTARQLAELGLAGGSGAYGLGTGDWTTSASVWAALLARRGAARIDQRVATRVAEMLASNDPQVLRNAYDIVSRNRGVMEAVRRAENDLARLTVPNAPQVAPQNVLPAAAEQNQNNAPR